MARAPRIHFPQAFYHVISRGNQRQTIFRDKNDYLKYQERLAHYQQRYDFLLHAYVLMPNHVHLLIEVGTTPLSQVMQGLQLTYTQYFNKRHKTVGHLFQGRYKAILCEKDVYLVELARYIHLNPVRAKLVKRPEDYRWSSHAVYLGLRQEPMVFTEFVLSQFSSKPHSARKSFQRFVTETIGEGSREDFYDVKLQTFLGSDEFVEKLPVRSHEERPLYRIPLNTITEAVCERLKVNKKELKEWHRARATAEARHVIGLLAKSLCGFSYVSVAKEFCRDPISFGIGVRRVEEKLKREASLRRIMEDLSQRLIQMRKKKY